MSPIRNSEIPASKWSEGTTVFVVFRLAEQRYALPLALVELALRMVAVAPVPEAPPWVSGVIDLHGRVIPVMDLRGRFGHPIRETFPDDRLLVVSLPGRTFALVADEVSEVLILPENLVETPPEPFRDSPYMKAVVRKEDGLIFIIDAAMLFPADTETLYREPQAEAPVCCR